MSLNTRPWPLLAALALPFVLPLTANAAAQKSALEQQFEHAPAMSLRLTWPVTTGFSAAKPVEGFTAAAENQWMRTAYRSASGCVAFFYPPDNEGEPISDVAFKWQGPACNGRPLNGSGELQIRYRTPDKQIISVLKGGFANGVLSGQGSKRNFSFTSQGATVQDTYLFDGQFADNVLHGEGRSRWIGPADGHPKAWLREGRFNQGALNGQVLQSRLAPYPGIAVETLQLWFDNKGQPYNNQARANQGEPVSGRLLFTGDDKPWLVDLIGYQNDGRPAGSLTRLFGAEHPPLTAHCMHWQLDGVQPHCQQGDLRYGLEPGLVIEQGGFVLDTPVRAGRTPFRALGHTGISFNSRLQADRSYPLRCNDDVSVCTGTGPYPSTLTNLYWQGRFEWRPNGITPVSGSLYQRASASAPASMTDEQWASCQRFDGPMSCADGALIEQHATFRGAWFYREPENRYRGYMEEAEDSPRDEGGFQRRGWGTLAFNEGRSARVRVDADDNLAEVGDCEDPDSDDTVSCSLRGNTVVFKYKSNIVYEKPVRQRDITPARPGNSGRYQPIETPKRTPYILPGMK